MKNNKIIECFKWLPNKNNENSNFWSIDILPQLNFIYINKFEYIINISWLFWSISININRNPKEKTSYLEGNMGDTLTHN
jgi:hypothetical protein